MQIKKNKLLSLTFLLILLIKLVNYWLVNYPIFENHNVVIYSQNGELIPIVIKEKSYQLVIELENHQNQNIVLNLDPNITWNIFIKGEKLNYLVDKGNIVIPLKSYDWGGVDIRITRQLALQSFINIIFYLSILLAVYLRLYRHRYCQYSSLIFIIIYLTIFIWHNWHYLNEIVDYGDLSKRYNQSQYVMGQGSPVVMGDEQVYVLASHQIIKSGDPIALNFEHPPLGKYIYGSGFVLTEKPRIVSLGLVIISFIIFYYLARIYLAKTYLSFPALILFTSNDLFLNLARTVMLDLPQLIFLLLATISFIKLKNDKKNIWYFLFAIFVGAMAASKFYLPALIFIMVCLIDIFFFAKKNIVKLLLFLILVPIVYIVSYLGFFQQKTFLDFVKFQWWLLHWFLGKKETAAIGAIYLVIMFGKIKTWWALEYQKIISFGEWNVGWPISFIIYLFSLISNIVKKIQLNFSQLWILCYLLILSTGAIAPNLLVIILPFLFLESVNFIDNKIKI